MRRIKEERTKLGLLQKQVAEIISMDRTTYAKYENGSIQPPIDVLVCLADLFNVSVDYLIERDKKSETEVKCDSESRELIELYEKLNDEGKETAMNTMRALAAYPELAKENPQTFADLA